MGILSFKKFLSGTETIKISPSTFQKWEQGNKKTSGCIQRVIRYFEKKRNKALILSDNSYSSDAVRLPDHLMMPPDFNR
jgi:hypothetical protein